MMRSNLKSVHIAMMILLIFLSVGILSPLFISDLTAKQLHTDRKNISPGNDSNHLMGTDILGRDVAAGMITGTRKSLFVGVLSTIIGAIVGIALGMIGGYYNQRGYPLHRLTILLGCIVIPILLFYLIYETFIFQRSWLWWFALLAFLKVGFIGLNDMLIKKSNGVSYKLDVDIIITKMVEIRKSIPTLFLLLALIPLFSTQSVWNIVIVLSILVWSDFARFARAETIALRRENYIKRVNAIGFSPLYIMCRHILPNILPTLIVVACFSVGGCILAESSISFLGIGVGIDEITWGSMMSEGRKTLMWWMILFPGMAIFLIIWSLNSVASYYQKEYEK